MHANNVFYMSLLQDSFLANHIAGVHFLEFCHFTCSPRDGIGQVFDVSDAVIDIAWLLQWLGTVQPG